MKQILALLLVSFVISGKVPIENALAQLTLLETYAQDYYATKTDISINELILRYIRTGRYDDTEWTIVAGSSPTEFINYVQERETAEGTSVSPIRKYGDQDIDYPDGTPLDFVHMFAVMNGIDYSTSFTKDVVTLQGWAGDTAQLFKDIFSLSDSLEALVAEARSRLDYQSGGFDQRDVISDLDSVLLMKYRFDDQSKTFSEILKAHMNSITHKQRVKMFVENSFPDATLTRNGLRTAVYQSYSKNTYVQIWECKNGVRQEGSILGIKTCYVPGDILEDKKVNHMAAGYAFADYLYEFLA